jgi:hypothetical protein
VRAARVAAIERMRKVTFERPPPVPGFPTKAELDGIGRDFDAGNIRKVIKLVKRTNASLAAANKILKRALKHGLSDEALSQAYQQALRRAHEEAGDIRDDVACLTRALPEILPLERYERRVLSRRRRAIRRFNALLV